MGYDQIRIIGKNLRDTPTYDGANKIEKDDFLTCLRDIGLFLPKAANEKLVQYYDKDIDGYVYFVEFLKALRGEPSEESLLPRQGRYGRYRCLQFLLSRHFQYQIRERML